MEGKFGGPRPVLPGPGHPESAGDFGFYQISRKGQKKAGVQKVGKVGTWVWQRILVGSRPSKICNSLSFKSTQSLGAGGRGIGTRGCGCPGSSHTGRAGSPAIAEQPAREGAVRCQPVHEGGGEQGHHQLHSEDRLGEGTGRQCAPGRLPPARSQPIYREAGAQGAASPPRGILGRGRFETPPPPRPAEARSQQLLRRPPPVGAPPSHLGTGAAYFASLTTLSGPARGSRL